MSARRLLSRALVLALASLAVLLVAGAASASAAGGWWVLSATSAPTKLQPGKAAVINFKASNAGYGTIVGSKEHPIVLRATLPAGFEATKELKGFAGPEQKSEALKREPHPLTCKVEGRIVTCPWEGPIPPTESIKLKAVGAMSAAAPAGTTTEATIEVGGGDATAPPAYTKTLEVTPDATPFGAERYEIRPENEKGEPETQAGAHPFQLTSIFDLNEKVVELSPTAGEPQELPTAAALPKDLHFVLPPGLIGKAAGVPRCKATSFQAFNEGGSNGCEEKTAIGYAVVSIMNPVVQGFAQGVVPVFNLEPEEGEPAQFGFEFHTVPVVLKTKVRSGKDYGVEVSVHEAPQSAAVLTTQLTLWGVPQDKRHDADRGWQCLEEGAWLEVKHPNCESQAQIEARENKLLEEEKKPPRPPEEAFLSMPTSCDGVPATTAEGVSWNGESFSGVSYNFFTEPSLLGGSAFTGCPKLPFAPSISVTPIKPQAATPSGYTVTVATDQKGTVTGKELADAAIKSTTLKLPAGVFASAGASQGLGTCTTEGFGFEGGGEPLSSESFGKLLANNEFSTAQLNETTCPASAKIGTVDIETPLLDEHLTGSVYLGHHDTNPFMSPLVLFIFAETPASEAFVKKGGEPKVQVKLAGEVKFEPNGQIVSTFGNTPPVQFSKLTLTLNDGPRAAQATPEKCGSYESAGEFEASSNQKRSATSSFTISEGAGGGPCNPAFAPSTEAGADSGQAGAFSPFKVVIRKPDGENQLRSINVTEPPGAAAILAGVAQCPTATAEQIAPETLPKRDAQSSAECPASSIIGKSVAVAGLGSGTYGAGAARVTLPGTVYLTGPYHGAPFGLLDVTDTRGHTGPFELGKIGVMSRILVDENTAQATVVSNPLPQFVEGVPASISEIMVDVDRPGFSFNPTNCSPLEVTGSLTGWNPGGAPEGSFPIHSPFHVSNCASLPFKPSLSVELEPNVSRVDGTGLVVKLKAAKGEANIHKTKLVFPTSIPSRLTTIQKSCDDHIFNINPANCPEGSVVGTAIARTPVLKSPLVGPAYLVSHANASFPDAEFVLQGEGIKLLLDGKTDIKKGITSSSFESVPDAPVETFEVKLPRGPHSAFSGFGDLCATPQNLPTEFVGQNGVTINLTTKAKLVNSINTGTSAVCSSKVVHLTELQKLLAKCKKVKKHSKRVKCEATARKQVKAVASCKKKNKSHKSKMNSCIAKARKTYALKL